MRFLISEQEDIHAVFTSLEVSREKYLFRKKRGWVYIDLLDGRSFSFFRVRKVELIENKFLEKFSYKFICDGQSQDIVHWAEVLEALKTWLLNSGSKNAS